MDSVLKSEPAMDILSGISLAEFLIIVLILIGAGATFYHFRDKVKGYLESYRKKANKQEAEKQKIADYDARIKQLEEHYNKDMVDMIEKQQQYRNQSLQKQSEIDDHFLSLENKLDNMTETLTKVVKDTAQSNEKMERNRLKDRLIEMHRYYTSLEKNPSQEWSEMEANNFWDLFADYEERGGNGYVHNIIKPDMEKLKVIYF